MITEYILERHRLLKKELHQPEMNPEPVTGAPIKELRAEKSIGRKGTLRRNASEAQGFESDRLHNFFHLKPCSPAADI